MNSYGLKYKNFIFCFVHDLTSIKYNNFKKIPHSKYVNVNFLRYLKKLNKISYYFLYICSWRDDWALIKPA